RRRLAGIRQGRRPLAPRRLSLAARGRARGKRGVCHENKRGNVERPTIRGQMARQRDEGSRGGTAVLGPVARERVLDARALAFLAEASAVLASSLVYEATLARVAQLAVPELADWCVVEVVAEGGAVRRVAVVCADRERIEVASRLRDSYPSQVEQSEGTAKALRTGQAEL